MYRTIGNLHYDRLSYSDAALIPKFTQSGLLGLPLPVQDHEAVSPTRQGSMWTRNYAAPRNARPIQPHPPRCRPTNKERESGIRQLRRDACGLSAWLSGITRLCSDAQRHCCCIFYPGAGWSPVKVVGSARNVTHIRRAIPIIQPGNSAYAAAFPGAGRVSGTAGNPVRVRRAILVVQPGRSRYATAF